MPVGFVPDRSFVVHGLRSIGIDHLQITNGFSSHSYSAGVIYKWPMSSYKGPIHTERMQCRRQNAIPSSFTNTLHSGTFQARDYCKIYFVLQSSIKKTSDEGALNKV